MKQKAFWAVFIVTQSTGAILFLTLPNVHPAHWPVVVIAAAFPLTVVLLFPGVLASIWAFDALRLPSADAYIIVVTVALNAIVWYGIASAVLRIRRRVRS